MLPTTTEQQVLYEFYQLIYNSHFALPKKRSLMTAVLGYERWSWRVVGITEAAIKVIAENKFRKPSRLLARDHTTPRSATYSKIFSEDMLPLSDWWEWVWEHDKTIMVTNIEHHSNTRSRIFEIDWTLGHFQSAGVAGWAHTKSREGDFVRQLVELHEIKI